MILLRNFIRGEYQPAKQTSLNYHSPVDLSARIQFVNSDFMDVVAAVQSANQCQKKWRESSDDQRKMILKNLGRLLSDHIAEFTKYHVESLGISPENSKRICEEALACFERIARYSPELKASSSSFQLNEPVGLIGLVTDWQNPFKILLEHLAVTISCANELIHFPDETSMRVSLRVAELAVEAGLPAGSYNVLLGRGAELAVHFVEHPGIKKIKFYGENNLGERLGRLAAENNKRIELVLGVNNAAIIFSDADLVSAVEKTLELSLEYHRYGRNRVNRILVQEKCYKDFTAELELQFKNLKQSDAGRMPSLQLQNEFLNYLSQSQKDRAKPHLSAANFLGGAFPVPITIYEDLTNCSTLYQQNLSGPILFLQSFKYAVDLPKTLNSGPYAYRAYVWTQDLVRIHKLASQIEVSQILFNPRAPAKELAFSTDYLKISGYGQSGIDALYRFQLNSRAVVLG